MGGEGIAIAIAVAFVMLSVIPAINRSRAILVRTVIDERFAADLRMLNTTPRAERNSHLRGINLHHNDGLERGKIYYSERIMANNEANAKVNNPTLQVETAAVQVKPADLKMDSGAKQDSAQQRKPKQRSQIRELASIRAMAKVRIQNRNARQRKMFFALLLLAALTVTAWILVPAMQLSVLYPVTGTVLTALSSAGFNYAHRQYHAENLADEKIIAKAAQKLRRNLERRGQNAKLQGKNSSAAAKTGTVKSAARYVRTAPENTPIPAEKSSVGRPNAIAEKSGDAAAAHPDLQVRMNPAAVPEIPKTHKLRKTHTAGKQKPLSEELQTNFPSRAQNAPSYTLKPKIQKRKVAPYTAAADASAELAKVPYRPVRIGERIGEGPLETANPAPKMTGKEELRSDVLGGGTTLDALLDRRRA